MIPEERQLIGDLFDRMRETGLSEKDREAEAFINQSMRATQDASYKLVQSVLIQEQALQEAGYRIEELEARVRELEDHVAQSQPAQSKGGGFLGGLFGGSKQAAGGTPTSVPVTGQRYQQQAPQQPMGTPWSQQQPPMQQGGFGQPPQRAGGGFMKTAAATAAGVAGGMLAAGAIRDMMGGGSGSAQAAGRSSEQGNEPSPYEVSANDPVETQQNDASDSDMGWDSGDTGGDADI